MPTDQYGVVGHPISHSRSPAIHARFARQTGEDLGYEAFDVAPGRFDDWVRAFFAAGGRGLNVTVPHKLAAAAFAHALTERARRAAAVNTLVARRDGTILGDNTDGVGLVRDLVRNCGLVLAGRCILLLGAGGATRGVIAPLLECAPAQIVIANRTAGRAAELAAHFRADGPVRGCGYADIGPRPYDLVINATAAGLSGERPQVSASVVSSGTFCYDMAYGGEPTPFLRWALAEGCGRAELGWGMLVEQAAEAFEVWRGVRPETRSVLDALRGR